MHDIIQALRGLVFGLRAHQTKQRVRAAFVAAALAFVLAQIFAAAHAVHLEDEPHDHLGGACVLCVSAGKTGEKAVLAAGFSFAAVFALWRFAPSAPSFRRVRVPVFAARPRSPPYR